MLIGTFAAIMLGTVSMFPILEAVAGWRVTDLWFGRSFGASFGFSPIRALAFSLRSLRALLTVAFALTLLFG